MSFSQVLQPPRMVLLSRLEQFKQTLGLRSAVPGLFPTQSFADSSFPVPQNEAERLQALHRYHILDSLPEQDFDDLTTIAAHICGTPISLISLLDESRQWFKSRFGLEATETPREHAFCSHAILNPEEVMVVPNALHDQRFNQNPLVTDAPNIRFYAGAPLVSSDGFVLGTLCVIDRVPRCLTTAQVNALQALSRQVMAQLELRWKQAQLEQEMHLKEQATRAAIAREKQLEKTLAQLQKTQVTLIQSEKMAAIGQLAAGIAHEINNPLNFIQGNLFHVHAYVQELIEALQADEESTIKQGSSLQNTPEVDLDFLSQDLAKILQSMKRGTERIAEIVTSLKTFSRLDEAEFKAVDIHEGIDSALLLLHHRLQATTTRPAIEVIKNYDSLPLVPCYAGGLNQVVMHLLNNAIDALDHVYGNHSLEMRHDRPSTIWIQTSVTQGNRLRIAIADNGPGMTEEVQAHIFEPFFTTKSVGQGSGLGLSISYRIVEELHQGQLRYTSSPDQGTTFIIEIPMNWQTLG